MSWEWEKEKRDKKKQKALERKRDADFKVPIAVAGCSKSNRSCSHCICICSRMCLGLATPISSATWYTLTDTYIRVRAHDKIISYATALRSLFLALSQMIFHNVKSFHTYLVPAHRRVSLHNLFGGERERAFYYKFQPRSLLATAIIVTTTIFATNECHAIIRLVNLLSQFKLTFALRKFAISATARVHNFSCTTPTQRNFHHIISSSIVWKFFSVDFSQSIRTTFLLFFPVDAYRIRCT